MEKQIDKLAAMKDLLTTLEKEHLGLIHDVELFIQQEANIQRLQQSASVRRDTTSSTISKLQLLIHAIETEL